MGGARGPVIGAGPPPGRTERRRPTTAWAAPQVLLSALLFVLALGYALTGGGARGVPAPQPLALGDEPRDQEQVEVRYVVVDVLGLERPGYADVELPAGAGADAGARLSAALAALRADLLESDVWPRQVEAPVGFVIELDRRRLAVIDVGGLPADLVVDVADELASVRSLVATARVAAAADEVRITVAGEERPSLWGRVALGDW